MFKGHLCQMKSFCEALVPPGMRRDQEVPKSFFQSCIIPVCHSLITSAPSVTYHNLQHHLTAPKSPLLYKLLSGI